MASKQASKQPLKKHHHDLPTRLRDGNCHPHNKYINQILSLYGAMRDDVYQDGDVMYLFLVGVDSLAAHLVVVTSHAPLIGLISCRWDFIDCFRWWWKNERDGRDG